MGWYSTPFNYDGTSPTQVRDDLQKANENFQVLSDVFENGTPLSGKIKSSYIPGGGGNVSGDITVNSVTISNPNEVNFGIDLTSNPAGFYQAAIKMPTGVKGSAIQWQPSKLGWGEGESKIGVDSDGNFRIIGRYNSTGTRRVMILSDDVNIDGNLTVGGTISVSAPTFQHIDIKTTSSDTYGLNFRNGVNNFTNSACIYMPPPGTYGNQILWGLDPAGDSRIGLSTDGTFFIVGSGASPNRVVSISDHLIVAGNLTVGGTISGNVIFPTAPTFQHVDIKTTSSDTYGLNFRNGYNNFTGSACIIMPSKGTYGNQILWGDKADGDCRIGVDTNKNFIIIGSYSNPADTTSPRLVTINDNLTVSGNLTVGGTISGNISLPSTPTFQHINIQTTSSDTYGLNFRNGYNNFTSSACILMPTSGDGNKISWGNPDHDSTIGLNSSGNFFIFGSGSTTRTVLLYDNLSVAGTVYQGSDLSMKENIELFPDSALSLIKGIDVYKYLFKADQREHVGFIANYVKDVFPMGVTVSEEDGKCSINILDMLALLFKAVKEIADHVANN